MRELNCIAHGRPGSWEAICLDFDLAVQGRASMKSSNLWKRRSPITSRLRVKKTGKHPRDC
jgi:hypothetical protein